MKFYKWVDGSWEVGMEIPDSELLESGMFRLEGEEVVLDTSKIFDVGLELESESTEEYCSEEDFWDDTPYEEFEKYYYN